MFSESCVEVCLKDGNALFINTVYCFKSYCAPSIKRDSRNINIIISSDDDDDNSNYNNG